MALLEVTALNLRYSRLRCVNLNWMTNEGGSKSRMKIFTDTKVIKYNNTTYIGKPSENLKTFYPSIISMLRLKLTTAEALKSTN